MTRLLRFIRLAIFLTLGALVGLIGFLAVRPAGSFQPATGPVPPPGAPEIRLLTWNVLRGENEHVLGAPWEERKARFTEALANHSLDVACLQEVLPAQLRFFQEEVFAGYHQVGEGRDGGQGGEFCPIFIEPTRFAVVASGTFWLSPTPETPGKAWGERVPRICTWAEVSERQTGLRFRVYNVHLQLHPIGQIRGAKLLAGRIGQARVPVILAGDLNSPPSWSPARILRENGLRAAERSGALTYHVGGKAVSCLDHIFIGASWSVLDGKILKPAAPGVQPSDHFGLSARLAFVPSNSD